MRRVVSPAPGTVNVYVLTGPVTQQPAPAPNSVGVANSALLAKVAAVLNADTIRPLTDTVNVLAVTEVDYQITATVTLYSDADPTATIVAATTAVAGTGARARRQDSARHRAEPDNRGAVGRGRLWRDAHVADSDAAHRGPVGELHDDLADGGVQHGA